MCRSVSTISDEIARNRVKGAYDPLKADHKAYVRRQEAKYQAMKIVERPDLRIFVEKHLYDDQSPQAIAGRIMMREKHLPTIGKASIYRYIASPYGRRIEYHRSKKKARRRNRRPKVTKLTNRVFIDKRPVSINKRMRIGHAEADFIVSGKEGRGILLVVADRRVRAAFLEQILNVTIKHVHQAFERIKDRYPEMRTFTTDNDVLLQHHQKLARLLKIKIYFCHPYSSWQKGSVENANGVIRRIIPKGSDISRYSKRFIRSVEDKLNRRMMECLDYQTPAEALEIARKQKKLRKRRRREKK